MDHLIVRVGRRRVLIADVSSSADGHGIGYGILLKRIDKVLWLARLTGMPVFYSRETRSINTAVFRLQGAGTEVLPRRGWLALWLALVWRVTAPLRWGAPWLWLQHVLTRVLLGSFYEWVEQSPRVPAALRRFVVQPRPLYRRLRDANARYAAISVAAWKTLYREQTYQPLHDAARQRRPIARPLFLPPEREREAVAQAGRLGIGPQARLVTAHVRETGYRAAAGLRQREWDVLRNARIETYADAFAALVARGYTVVRLGDRTMTPISQPGVVDLANSPDKTEWLEAWCVLRSEFLIGCDSGPSWLAVLAGVPVLTVNALHFRDFTRPVDRFICKLARERATGRTLAIADMVTDTYLRNGLDTATYEHIDNEPHDLEEAAIDMIDVVAGREQRSKAQRGFLRHVAALAADVHEWSGIEGIALATRARGNISRRFVERHWQHGRPPSQR